MHGPGGVVPGPGGLHGPGGGWCLVLGGPGGDPPKTATAAGGTHPTGMHSCLRSPSFHLIHINRLKVTINYVSLLVS